MFFRDNRDLSARPVLDRLCDLAADSYETTGFSNNSRFSFLISPSAAGGKSIDANTFSLSIAFVPRAWHAQPQQFFHDEAMVKSDDQPGISLREKPLFYGDWTFTDRRGKNHADKFRGPLTSLLARLESFSLACYETRKPSGVCRCKSVSISDITPIRFFG
jgi:hypothetical protein